MIAAEVGGIPEIVGPHRESLVPPNDPAAMAQAIAHALDHPAEAIERAKLLRERVFLNFSQKAMVDGILAAYRDAFTEH
jgi:glycosyltransferase involved in cell wall biosynthesis